jgi:hypothetical protein
MFRRLAVACLQQQPLKLSCATLLMLNAVFSPSVAKAQTNEEQAQILLKMQAEISKLKQTVESQDRKINELSNQAGAGAATKGSSAAQKINVDKSSAPVTLNVQDKTVPSKQSVTASAFNPAIGTIIDTAAEFKEGGQTDFQFRSAELSFSANVDPFTKGWAIFNGTEEEVEVEEAALQTTALPYNLKLTGGRFFADFGRLSKFHGHDLPFVNRPEALERFVGGEAQATGAELSWLAPLDQYLGLTFGAYEKIGEDNDRFDEEGDRGMDRFTYLGRAATFVELSDSNSLDIGTSYAYTPKVESEDDKSRTLAGVDLTYRYTPLNSASYRGIVWGTEWLYNDENFAHEDGDEQTFSSHGSSGLYSYLELKLSRQIIPGFLFDYAESLDGEGDSYRGYSPYLSFWLSEFQRLRFQYSYIDDGNESDNRFYVQWTGALGSHVHGFKDR